MFIYNSLLLFICSLNFDVLLEDNPGTSSYWDENKLALSEGQDDNLPEMLSESISHVRYGNTNRVPTCNNSGINGKRFNIV